MTLKEKLEKAKEERKTVGMIIGRAEAELIRGTITEVNEDCCVIKPEGSSYYGFSSLTVPFSGVVFLGL